MKVLVVDVGGTHVKILATGQRERQGDSGPKMTARRMVSLVKRLSAGWSYDHVAIGYPGPVAHGHPVAEPRNLGGGWVGFDFRRAFGHPVKVINDAAMQALGSYRGGRMLFLGLGTGLGSALIVDGVIEPMEIAHLPYKNGRTFEDYVGIRGLERLGKTRWRKSVVDVVERFRAAFGAEDVVIGGGNVAKLNKPPPGARFGDNANAFRGGFRSWIGAAAPKGETAMTDRAEGTTMQRLLEVVDDQAALMEAAATIFVTSAEAAIAARGRFLTAISGGSTPRALFELLASDRYASSVDWARVHVRWGDERAVPPDAKESNYRMAREALLGRVAIPASQVHRILSEQPPSVAATAYEQTLRALFATPLGAPSTAPGARFDLVLLGIGDNGHTASFSPGLRAVREAERWVVAERVAEVAMWRVTLTPVVLNAAAEVVFLVSGADKAAMLHQVLEGPAKPDLLFAQIIAPQQGRLRWLVDTAAASLERR
jgi:polyphosphate glucokinase